jgi:hypothetical protein
MSLTCVRLNRKSLCGEGLAKKCRSSEGPEAVDSGVTGLWSGVRGGVRGGVGSGRGGAGSGSGGGGGDVDMNMGLRSGCERDEGVGDSGGVGDGVNGVVGGRGSARGGSGGGCDVGTGCAGAGAGAGAADMGVATGTPARKTMQKEFYNNTFMIITFVSVTSFECLDHFSAQGLDDLTASYMFGRCHPDKRVVHVFGSGDPSGSSWNARRCRGSRTPASPKEIN